jgi:alpha-galactosidase/6-phospho-beta-glucosidase family protein
MTTNNTELISRISEYITSQTNEITKNELKKAVGDIFDELKKSKKKSGNKSKKNNDETKKRPPSVYNMFIKTQMEILKNQTNNVMNGKQKMEYIANLWKQEKGKEEEIKEEEIKEEEIKEEEEQPIKNGKTPRKGLGPKK